MPIESPERLPIRNSNKSHQEVLASMVRERLSHNGWLDVSEGLRADFLKRESTFLVSSNKRQFGEAFREKHFSKCARGVSLSNQTCSRTSGMRAAATSIKAADWLQISVMK